MVLGALTSQLKLESSEDFSPICLAPCWDGWLASLFHTTSPNKYPELPHGMAVSLLRWTRCSNTQKVEAAFSWSLCPENWHRVTSAIFYMAKQSSNPPKFKGKEVQTLLLNRRTEASINTLHSVLHGLHHKQKVDGRVSSSGSDSCTCEYPHPQVITVLLLGNKKRCWWIMRVSYLQCFHFTADLQGWASY